MTPPVSGGVPEPAECELEAIAALLQSAENYRAATWAGPSYANVARWLYDRGVRIQEVRVGGVPEQGPQVYPDLTDEQIEEIARILDEPQLKRLHGAILALSLRYVAAVQEAPRAIRQLRAALERPRPALPNEYGFPCGCRVWREEDHSLSTRTCEMHHALWLKAQPTMGASGATGAALPPQTGNPPPCEIDAQVEAVRVALDKRLRDYDFTIRDGTYPRDLAEIAVLTLRGNL